MPLYLDDDQQSLDRNAFQHAQQLVQNLMRQSPELIPAGLESLYQELNTLEQRALAQTEEWKRTRAELAESRDRFSSLYDFAPTGHLTLDDGGRIVEVNRATAQLLRTDRGQMIGMNLGQFIAANSQKLYQELLKAIFGCSIKQLCEVEINPAFGPPLMVRIEGIAIDRDGPQPHRECLAVLVDVTVCRRAEQALRHHNETLEQVARLRAELMHVGRTSAIGELASGISHELNQPLAAIANYACALSSALDQPGALEGKAELCRSLAEKLEAQVARGGDIIRRLQGLIRTQAPLRSQMPVRALVADVLALLESELQATQTQVLLDLPESLPPLEVDRIQIQHVLFQLCANAIEAMRKSCGEHKLQITAQRASPTRIAICVRDWGPGIPSEVQQILFTPLAGFSPNGMGLGLAISRRIVEAHGGVLRIAEKVSPGIEFCCELPIARTQAADTSQNDAATDKLPR